MSSLTNKRVLVTGGGGFIGSTLVEQIIDTDPTMVRVFDHDQQRMFRLQNRLKQSETKLQYMLGDLRDESRVSRAMEGIDVVFHVGAVKHVEMSEYNPTEAVQTNIQGTRNLIQAAIGNDVDSFTAVSTDKAADPSSVMGATKLIMERVVTAAAAEHDRNTSFNCVRFGNVLGSTGSVVPIFLDQISNGGPITVTDPDMTRFIMPVERAVELVRSAHEYGSQGRIFVLKMPAFRVGDLAKAIKSTYAPKYGYSRDDIDIEHIGRRPGERTHEKLLSHEELDRVEELEEMFVIHPDVQVNDGLSAISNSIEREYTSANATLLERDEIISLINRTNAVEEEVKVEV